MSKTWGWREDSVLPKKEESWSMMGGEQIWSQKIYDVVLMEQSLGESFRKGRGGLMTGKKVGIFLWHGFQWKYSQFMKFGAMRADQRNFCSEKKTLRSSTRCEKERLVVQRIHFENFMESTVGVWILGKGWFISKSSTLSVYAERGDSEKAYHFFDGQIWFMILWEKNRNTDGDMGRDERGERKIPWRRQLWSLVQIDVYAGGEERNERANDSMRQCWRKIE